MQTITKNITYKIIEEGWCWGKDYGYYNSNIYPTYNKAIEAAKKELGTNISFNIIFCKVIEITIKNFVELIVDKINEIFDNVTQYQKVNLDKIIDKTCDKWPKKYELNFVHTIFDKSTYQKIILATT